MACNLDHDLSRVKDRMAQEPWLDGYGGHTLLSPQGPAILGSKAAVHLNQPNVCNEYFAEDQKYFSNVRFVESRHL